MTDPSAPERRFERVPVEMSIHLSTIDPEPDPRTGRPFFRASREVCANLSEGGAFIRTGEPLSPGRRVLLEIPLPQGGSIEAVGRVAWSRRVLDPSGQVTVSGVGVEFIAGARDRRTPLQGFLEHYGGAEAAACE